MDKSWLEYWEEMGKDAVWVDAVFVQLTAWYIGLDIKILTTSSTPENPFIIVSGNISNSSDVKIGPPLILGNYTNVHYQSLLPIDNKVNESQSLQNVEDYINDKNIFIYLNDENIITFSSFDNGKLQCPFCQKIFTRIISHITSQQCTISKAGIQIEEFTKELESFREGFRLEMGRKRKQKSRVKLNDERGKDTMKKVENQWKKKSMANLIEKRGKDTVKYEQNQRKEKSMAN